jgi:hypothetical protein
MLALVGKDADSILSSRGNLSQWRTLISESSFATSPPERTCAITKLTVVAFAPGGQPIVGANCSQPGRVGIFEYTSATWRSFAPRRPASMSYATIQVIRLISVSGTVSAIVAARTGSHTVLIAARYGPGLNGWEISHPLAVAQSVQVLSSGTSSGGVFVVLSSGSPKPVEVERTLGASWARLPTVPDGTETIATASGGQIDALVPKGSVFAVYRLDVSEGRWRRAQVINVPIEYDSSS